MFFPVARKNASADGWKSKSSNSVMSMLEKFLKDTEVGACQFGDDLLGSGVVGKLSQIM